MKNIHFKISFMLAVTALISVGCGKSNNPSSESPTATQTQSTGTPSSGSTSSIIPPSSSTDTSSSSLPPSPSTVTTTGGTPAPTEKPLALIYKGPGSCSLADGDAGVSGYGCSEASADAATTAGFRYQYVGPTDLPENASDAQVTALFGSAKVWIQPGGYAGEAWSAMTSKLRTQVSAFVKAGGGYVGFCAGAFLAADGFNVFPGTADLYNYSTARSDVDYALLDINWLGSHRKIYFEGGPYFHNLNSSVEVTATFGSGTTVAAARAAYGSGRVYVSGPHPEAPQIWSNEDGISDPDGSDLDLAAGMIKWAGGVQ